MNTIAAEYLNDTKRSIELFKSGRSTFELAAICKPMQPGLDVTRVSAKTIELRIKIAVAIGNIDWMTLIPPTYK